MQDKNAQMSYQQEGGAKQHPMVTGCSGKDEHLESQLSVLHAQDCNCRSMETELYRLYLLLPSQL